MTKRFLRRGYLLIFIISTLSFAKAQDYPYEVDFYPFIKYDKNKLLFFDDSSSFERLFDRFDKLVFYGQGQIDIVHIGGSHIQADMWSNQMRQRLQTFHPGNKGSRGFIFPYKLAKTNNPYNYKVTYTGEWEGCRSVKRDNRCSYGLSAVSAFTYDSITTINITLRDKIYLHYDFNKVIVFHNAETHGFNLEVVNVGITDVHTDTIIGFTEFTLENYVSDLSLIITRIDTVPRKFEIYGIKLDNGDPGITYHAIGANGASVPTYLRCSKFQQHLAVIKPDLVILSIGINDAYESNFNSGIFAKNYDSLIAKIKAASPNTAILFTTNNDSYKRRRYLNYNGEVVKKVMYSLAKKHKCGVWDLYTIMGGLNSVTVWERFGLAKRDKIHFTKQGYILVGNLMFNAMLRSYDNHIEKKKAGIF